ncbi:MAG: hypothetical protein EBT03_11000 [Betaproteobacteria bacterium]|nr:hypothetical protein [Betaproteobacteria bacterium]NBT75995.1 hypothetical protein [Betaproteobacteria bacterium]
MPYAHIFPRLLGLSLFAATLAGCASSSAPPSLGSVFYEQKKDPVVLTGSDPSYVQEIVVPGNGKSIAVTELGFKSDDLNHKDFYGLAAEVRAGLIRSGYRVVQTRFVTPTTVSQDHFLDALGRIESGEFAGADYVLHGVVTGNTFDDTTTPIDGTRSQMRVVTLGLVASFGLIDVQTRQVLASFVATGSAKEQAIDATDPLWRPKVVPMMQALGQSLSADVAKRLNSQNVVMGALNTAGSAADSQPVLDKRRLSEEGATLKVYR